MDDLEAMRLALARAHSVEGRTSPRPPVGAVVVREGIVVGQGATSPPYGPHAEVHALQQAGSAAAGADLYVTLEPCCVTIHTPPCTTAIIDAGIRRVIVGALDPNPQVNTRGLAQLRAADIEVLTGVLESEAMALIRPFATSIMYGRPYVTAKWAMTLDGKLATRTGDSYWISGQASRVWVHNLRDRVDAVMVGSTTARVDNPQLTVRLMPDQRMYERSLRRGPLRVVLSTHGQLPDHLHLFQRDLVKGTCVIVGETCSRERQQHLQARGIDLVQVAQDAQGRIDLVAALQALAAKGIMHVLLEGGAELLGSAFDQCLIDHVAVFIAPKLVGGSTAPVPVQGHGLTAMADALPLRNMTSQLIGSDLLIEGEIVHDPA